jgi:membrane protease YdiL (CAAX protease family)
MPTNALVKVGLFLLVWAIAWLPIALVLSRWVQWRPLQPVTPQQKLPLLASLYLLAPLLVGLALNLENSTWADCGLAWRSQLALSLLLGLGLGLGGLTLVFTIEWALGWVQWHPENYQRLRSLLLPLLGVGLWVGVTEELVFRGFFINELVQTYGLVMAAVLSSLIFALLHLLWEQQETLPQLPGLWLMGMVLAGARWVDGGSLGLAWGIHAAWIWGLSCLDAADLMSYTAKGSPWLTGFNGQPLAGIAGLACLLGTGACLWTLSGF